jgi:hypothetical protein
MGGHIVRPLIVMHVMAAFGREPRKEGQQIGLHLGCGIFLDQQRCRRMAAEEREQPGIQGLPAHPAGNVARDFVEALAGGGDLEAAACLAHALSGRRAM